MSPLIILAPFVKEKKEKKNLIIRVQIRIQVAIHTTWEKPTTLKSEMNSVSHEMGIIQLGVSLFFGQSYFVCNVMHLQMPTSMLNIKLTKFYVSEISIQSYIHHRARGAHV